MTNLKEQNIKFAIENGYMGDGYTDDGLWFDMSKVKVKVNNYSLEAKFYDGISKTKINFIQLITSQEFIEAVARGVLKTGKKGFKPESIGLTNINGEWVTLETIIQRVTIDQAIAIRDGKLDEFIKDILNSGEL